MRRVTSDRSIVGKLTVNLGAAHDAAIVSRRQPVVKCTASNFQLSHDWGRSASVLDFFPKSVREIRRRQEPGMTHARNVGAMGHDGRRKC